MVNGVYAADVGWGEESGVFGEWGGGTEGGVYAVGVDRGRGRGEAGC